MAVRRNIWWTSVTCIIFLSISGSGSCTIEGTLNGDVLLPCIVPYKDKFKDVENFVVHWQTLVNLEVLHSFYHGVEQLDHQNHRFKGRTQIFPLEFPKGNLSILLKRINMSDAGSYSCHVYFSDKKEDHIIHQVELLIKEVTEEPDARYTLYGLLFLIGCLLLLSLPVICALKWMSRTKGEVTEEPDARYAWYGLLRLGCLLLLPIAVIRALIRKCTTRGDSYQRFKGETCQRTKTCCKIGQGCEKESHCLERELIVLKNANPLTDISDDFQEADMETITSREMFTVQNKRLTSERMLLLGDAAMGKTCLCEEVELDWNNGRRELCYKRVIYFTFSELSSFSTPLNAKQLIEFKCKNSTPIPIDLLSSGTLLIFDGLDKLMHDVEDSEECPENDETPMNITTLLSGILRNKLLPEIHVLVTSGFNVWRQWKEHFTLIFAMREFEEKDIQKQIELFCKLNGLTSDCYKLIQRYNLSSLVSVPLLNLAFCEICREQGQNLEGYEGKLDTRTRLFASLLHCTLRNISPEVAVPVEERQPIVQAAEPELNPNIKKTWKKLAELSYEKLITNCHEIEKKDLPQASDLLLKHLCKFFLIEESEGSVYKYRHYSVRDMFATFYCAGKIRNNAELEECLDAWAFGKNSATHPERHDLLQGITGTKQEHLQNFIRFFLGFLAYASTDDILFSPGPLEDDRRQFLSGWLREWIHREDIDLLNIFHCVFELHDDEVTGAVSSCFTSVSLNGTQLHPFDLTVIQYCLSEAALEKLEKLDLRGCGLRDGSLDSLPMIRRFRNVWLTSNKLTEKSAEKLGEILTCEDCTIENLLLGGNKLGPAGARNLWKSLKKNKSLRVLFLDDNEITDEGTEGMAKSLKRNTSLKELLLCGNPLGKDAAQNITQLGHSKLKIIFRIADHEDQLSYMMEKVDSLAKPGLETGDRERILYMLKPVQKDITQGGKTGSKRVLQLEEAIKRQEKKIE